MKTSQIKTNILDSKDNININSQNKIINKENPSQFDIDINIDNSNQKLINSQNKKILFNSSNNDLNNENKLKIKDNNYYINNLNKDKENIDNKHNIKSNKNENKQNIKISHISNKSSGNKIQSSLISSLREDKGDNESDEAININEFKKKKDSNILNIKNSKLKVHDTNDINKSKITKINKGINHYEKFIISIINYFNNLKSKEEKELIQINNNISNIINIKDKKKNKKEIEKEKIEKENIEKECKQLIRQFIRKISYIKRLYIYLIVIKYYCKDINEKRKIIIEGNNLIDKAKKDLENIYNNIIIILNKKFNGDKDLIIKYLKLIISKLNKYQRITNEEIEEAKKKYKVNKMLFEKLKEEKDENDEDKKNVYKAHGSREIIRNEEVKKEYLVENVNNDGKTSNRRYYRLWGLILPLIYIGHYLYYNYRNISNE